MKLIIKTIVIFGALGWCFWSCSKDEVLEEPYGPGKEPLGITMNRNQVPSPSVGLPGAEVTINASGLLPFREELVFRFNGEIAQIVEVTDTYIKVIVPEFASTGVTTISVGDIVIFGPRFSVTGKIFLDPSFNVARGTNGSVEKVIWTEDGRMIVIGQFTNYDNRGVIRPINRIARAFADGTYDASLRTGNGANGALFDIIPFGNGFLISGGFNGFAQRGADISNLTRLNANGTIDTVGVQPFRRPDQSDTTKYVPRFNGGFDGAVGTIFPVGNQVIVNGGFRYYLSRRYDQPNKLETRDSVIVDSIEVRQLARLNSDGSLDKTYRFNEATNRSLESGNGFIVTYLHESGPQQGKLMVSGGFTRFDGQTFGRILRLKADGTIDETFNPGAAGADLDISKLSYNPATRKYLITGSFRNYNGHPVNQIAQLNEDGTHDDSFVAKPFGGGEPVFSKQLSDGKIVVSGYFQTYDGIARNGFMILDESGNLIPGYNATGLFNGYLTDVIETTAADGRRALLLYGGFWQFNSQEANNIIRVIIE